MTTLEFWKDLQARGIRLDQDGGDLFVEADEELLTPDLLATIREQKEALIALTFCRRCASPMEQIEAGYFSCQNCHYQLVEARSGFWVDWLTPEEKSNEKLHG